MKRKRGSWAYQDAMEIVVLGGPWPVLGFTITQALGREAPDAASNRGKLPAPQVFFLGERRTG
jgi:hypothetical protein